MDCPYIATQRQVARETQYAKTVEEEEESPEKSDEEWR